jgi:hypothetical protein
MPKHDDLLPAHTPYSTNYPTKWITIWFYYNHATDHHNCGCPPSGMLDLCTNHYNCIPLLSSVHLSALIGHDIFPCNLYTYQKALPHILKENLCHMFYALANLVSSPASSWTSSIHTNHHKNPCLFTFYSGRVILFVS